MEYERNRIELYQTVPTIASLNDTESSERGPAATRDPSTQADEASGSQKVWV